MVTFIPRFSFKNLRNRPRYRNNSQTWTIFLCAILTNSAFTHAHSFVKLSFKDNKLTISVCPIRLLHINRQRFHRYKRARFGSTYTKIGTIQRRLAWPLRKDDTQIREAFQIFFHFVHQFKVIIALPLHFLTSSFPKGTWVINMLKQVFRKQIF